MSTDIHAPRRAGTHLPSGLVTFLFTDIEGSTRLAQLLGPEYRPVLHDHRQVLRRALSAQGGVELFTEGDSFFFAFADTTGAITACLAAQRALEAHRWPAPQARPRVRMGLHSGYAQPYAGEYASPEVHRAARVAAAAHGGQVLCSAAAARRAALPDEARLLDLGLHRLRGFDGRERLFQLVAPGLEQRFPRLRTDDVAPHNLPAAVTSFVGRDREQARLQELLTRYRLVTAVGPGGAGKTRLGLEVAGGQVDAYPDGVWFLDLATVTDAGLVAVTLAATLGLRPEPGRPVLETLADHTGSRRLLLLLDTCDAHLGAVAPVVSRLLAAGRGVRVLATSREPVGISGEVVWRIPPLSLEPAPGGGPSDAVALLVDRTVAARGGQATTPDELPHLARVAARLDGLPLAIELAAARLRVLTAGQLAERVDAELTAGPADLLGTLDAGRTGSTGPVAAVGPGAADRHRTLQAAVGWSYRTLAPDAARLLRWLSVFARPAELASAGWLLDRDPLDPLDPLTVLVDKSLLQAEPTGGRTATDLTYRMLDPIRAYAARALAQAGEEQQARDRHLAWALHALDLARLNPDGSPATLSMDRLEPLADEVRAALRWSVLGGSARSGLRLAGGMDQWWRERGLAREGRLWLFRLYGRIAETGETVPEAELGVAYHMHAQHAGADGEYPEALRFARRAEAAARHCGDPGLLARVLAGKATPLLDLGHLAEAEQVCREVIGWAAAHGVAGEALQAVNLLASLLWRRGALDEAADLLAAARPVEAAEPARRGWRGIDMRLGMVALARGDLVAAHDHLMVTLRSRMEHGYHSCACQTLFAVAVRCALAGDPRTAARLFGAAQSSASALGLRPGVFGRYWVERQTAVRAALGDAEFDAAYAAGSACSLAEAVGAALAIEHPDLAPSDRSPMSELWWRS